MIGVVEDKENIEISPTNNAADENFEVRAETEYDGQNNELYILVRRSEERRTRMYG